MPITEEEINKMPIVNPNWCTNGRNMWGQTEEQFWAMVEDLYRGKQDHAAV